MQTAMDLVRLNAVQPGMVPPLATGYKVVDLDANLATALKQWNRDALARCVDDPRASNSTDSHALICSLGAHGCLQCWQCTAKPWRA